MWERSGRRSADRDESRAKEERPGGSDTAQEIVGQLQRRAWMMLSARC